MSIVAEGLTRRSWRGRLTLLTAILGSGSVLLDSAVVNIALPSIGQDLDSSLGGLQWVSNGAVLTLASLILVAGSLGDRLGRRRVYVIGVVWFALASLLCALAPTTEWLVAARLLQGAGAALLTPGSLAIIQASFCEDDRADALATWAGVSGLATAAGPLVGGWMLEQLDWRWIFLINLPICALILALALTTVPESRDPDAVGPFDLAGGALTTVALAALTWLLVTGPQAPRPLAVLATALAVTAAAAFLLVERRARYPLVPLALFSSRIFAAANVMTFLVYGALGAMMFFVVLQLQTSVGFTPLATGVATVPLTVVLLLFSGRMTVVAENAGPRLPMTVGPLVCAAGALVLSAVGPGSGWPLVLGGMAVFGFGLSMQAAPLTAAVLAAAPVRMAGSASAVNTAVARTGILLAVAALPAMVGLADADYLDPDALTQGYRRATYVIAGLLIGGAMASWFGLGAGGDRPLAGHHRSRPHIPPAPPSCS